MVHPCHESIQQRRLSKKRDREVCKEWGEGYEQVLQNLGIWASGTVTPQKRFIITAIGELAWEAKKIEGERAAIA